MINELSKTGLGPAAIARELGMARSSVYRLLEEADNRVRP
jgi:DNA-binding IclR family transcriptional regulator